MNQIQQLSGEALMIASMIASLPTVKDFYHEFSMIDRVVSEEKSRNIEFAKKNLRWRLAPIQKEIQKLFGNKMPFYIQFHLPPATSLLRLWREPGNRDGGDDLSSYRPSVVMVNQTHRPATGMESGRFNCYIRGIVSIDDGKEHLGSVECFFPLTRIANILKGIQDEALAIYILKSSFPKTTKPPSVKEIKGAFIKLYSPESSWLDNLYNEKLLEAGLKKEVIRFIGFRGISAFPIKNIMGKNFGVIVFGKDYSNRLRVFQHTVFGIIALFIVAFGILLVILIFIERTITRPVSSITDLIKNLSSGSENLSFRLNVATKDEIGNLSQSFNRFMERMENLRRFKTIIEEDESLAEVYQRLSTLLKETFHITTFTIYEVNNSKNHIIPVIVEGEPEGGLWCEKEILTDANLCRSKRTSKEVSSRFAPYICPRFIGEEKMDYLCIPIIIGESTGMILQIVTPKSGKEPLLNMETVDLLKTYLDECAPVISSKRLVGLLKETTTTDALTGLSNRRFLGDSFETLASGILRRNSHMGVLMADIDFFKQVNDTYGHDTGDKILKCVARIFKENIRRSDVIVRYGGEEFLVLLMDVQSESVVAVAEKIRKAIEGTSFPVPGGVLKKTISIGVSLFPDDTENFWQCVKYADVALYKAKEAGRNRVVVFKKEMWDKGLLEKLEDKMQGME